MDDGGRAFPCPTGSDGGALHSGMSLRDYFAGKAMQGILSDPDERPDEDDPTAEIFIEETANFAYQMADAMLWERNREQ